MIKYKFRLTLGHEENKTGFGGYIVQVLQGIVSLSGSVEEATSTIDIGGV